MPFLLCMPKLCKCSTIWFANNIMLLKWVKSLLTLMFWKISGIQTKKYLTLTTSFPNPCNSDSPFRLSSSLVLHNESPLWTNQGIFLKIYQVWFYLGIMISIPSLGYILWRVIDPIEFLSVLSRIVLQCWPLAWSDSSPNVCLSYWMYKSIQVVPKNVKGPSPLTTII